MMRSSSRARARRARKTPPSSRQNWIHRSVPACSSGSAAASIAEQIAPEAGEIDRISPAPSPLPPQPAHSRNPPQADLPEELHREGDLYLTHLKVPGRAVRKIVL